jgi:tetratricopeptide (TPR) repeat protein
MPVIASLAYAFSRDTLGLRRTIDRLARQVADGFKYEPYLQLARGEYLRERGDAEAARKEIEAVVANTEMPMIKIPALPALAETLLALGQHERAKQVAQQGIDLGANPDWGNLLGELRSIRALALAEAALGAHNSAAQHLDDAIARAADRDSPLLSGSLHEARARVALAAGDALGYHHHLAECDHLFRSTRNPVLVARVERLSEAGVRHGAQWSEKVEPATQPSSPGATQRQRDADVSVVATEAVTTPPPAEARSWVSAVLSGCRGSGERAARALDLVVSEAHGSAGYLFLRHHGQLVLAAPTWGDEPPAELARVLQQAVSAPNEPATVADIRRGGVKLDWRPIPLVMKLGDVPYAIGGVAVIAGAMPLVDPDPKLLAELARELFEAGDVTHTRTMA